MTYSQLESASDRMAEYLQSLSLAPGDRAAVLFENGIEYVILFFAVLKAGLVAVPLDTSLGGDSLARIVADCGARVLFAQMKFRRKLPELLKAQDYATAIIGKWHLGNPKILEFSPKARGFAESVWFPGQRKRPPLQFFRHGEQGKTDDPYVDEAMAREASAFVEKHCAEPWFLYVAFLTPHQPLDTPPGSEAPFAHLGDNERRKCAAMMTELVKSSG